MPTFELSGPDGGTYHVDAPDEHAAVAAFSQFSQPAAAAPDIGENRASALAAIRGVPILGAYADKAAAALNAAAQPLIDTGLSDAPNFSDRMAADEAKLKAGTDAYEKSHPIGTTIGKMAIGTAATAPLMALAPEAFGLAGPMSQMVRNGAISGAALSGADAMARGEDPISAAETGGIIGGAAGPVGRGVGKVVSAIADRVRPPATVPQNVASVAGVDIPMSGPQISQNTADSAEAQIIARGGRGIPAQERAQSFNDLQSGRVDAARDKIGASLDPSGASSGIAPQDAAERVASELIAKEQAQQAADAGARNGPMSPAQNGDDLARSFDPSQHMRAANPADAGESLSDRLAAARDAAKADYRAKYKTVGEQPGEFAAGSAAGFRSDIEKGLAASDNPVSLDATNTPKSLSALQVVEDNLNKAGPGAAKPIAAPTGVKNYTLHDGVGSDGPESVRVGRRPNGDTYVQREGESPIDATNLAKAGASDAEIIQKHLGGRVEPAEAAPSLGPDHVQNVADVRKKFGDDVAGAYDRQKQAAADPAAAPKAQSLLEFLASKGGLGPDQELEAIGAHSHTVNVEGVGRRKLVRQGGWPLDYAREAAEEAGYFRGDHNGTSGVNDLLDAVDSEMRGQKRYPEGAEGYQTKRESAAMGEREQYEQDHLNRGFEDDLAQAGHGALGPEVKQRAVRLMGDGMDPDSAVEHAMSQLDQEDAAAGSHGFPGDSAAPVGKPGAAAPETPGSAFTMRDVEQVRKQLSTFHGDARRAMMAGGSGADVYALEHIMDHFDGRVSQMVADGKFSGDGPAVLKMQQAARASFADYKQKFAKRGSGDTIGAAVEKILGKFSDTKATPDEVVRLSYGTGSAPGGQMPVQVAQRIAKIFGRGSEEFATYKQGLFHQLTDGEPAKAAARIDEFLNGTKGKLLAQTVFDAGERARLATFGDRLRSIVPREREAGPAAAAVRRITGADGAPPSSPNDLVNTLFGSSGKGSGSAAVPLAQRLKADLSPAGWNAVRQGMWSKLTNAGEGKIGFEAQAMSQRLHEFLNESGSQLAKTLYSPKELDLMSKLAAVYKQMIPVKGTTNPSGTAPMLAKMAGGLRHTLLPLLGLTHGGIPGAAVAFAADKGVTALTDARAARKAVEMFYGPQAKRAVDPRFAKGAGLLSKGALPAINQRRS